MRQGKKISYNSDLKKANFNIAKGSYHISIAFCLKQLSLVYEMKPFIGRLRKSGGQKIDLISLLLNKFS